MSEIFRVYILLRFKHAVWALQESELVGFVCLLVVSEIEEGVVTSHLPIGPL